MKDICLLSDAESRAITAENPTGGKGRGGLATKGNGAAAARELGPRWKVSPCRTVEPGGTLVLADVDGPGRIRHIWIADDCKIDRRLVIRFFWDGAAKPSVPDSIRFKEDIRVTVQDLGWRSGGRYLSRRDDVSTVAYWYQSEPFTDFPPFPSRAALEIV